MMDGALLVDKPAGVTSHDVVAWARRVLRTPRIGHTGTLDPLATGLLVLLVGRATRLAQFLVADEKEYVAGIRLGVSTPTYDAEGLAGADSGRLGRWALGGGRVEEVLAEFRGTFLQTPPPYSAKKVDGVRAYKQARRQKPVTLEPVEVTVKDLERLPSDDDTLLVLRIVTSAGFYVRSLAHDIGRRLGCGAHLETLRRTRAGTFRVDAAGTLDALEREPGAAAHLLPIEALLAHLPALTLLDEGVRRAVHGNTIAPLQVAGGLPPGDASPLVQLLEPGGRLIAVARRDSGALLHPVVVLV